MNCPLRFPSYLRPIRRNEVSILQHHEDEHREQHGAARRKESPPEARGVGPVAVAKRSADERGDEGTHVDAHIEDGEGRILALVVRRVEVAHHRGDVRLEETVAYDECG